MNLLDAGLFEFAGLPLHPLLVHAAVVLTPLTALAAGLAAVWPAARRRLGLALPIAALIVAILVPFTVLASEALADVVGRTPAVQRHEALGLMLIPWAIALLPSSFALWWTGRRSPESDVRRPRWASILISAVTVAVAAGTIALVVLTGEAGARALWEGMV